MKTYTFPLVKSYRTLITSESLRTSLDDAILIFKDGKSCHVRIAFVFSRDANVKGLDSDITFPEYGNAIVTDGTNWYQIAYKQTSPKA